MKAHELKFLSIAGVAVFAATLTLGGMAHGQQPGMGGGMGGSTGAQQPSSGVGIPTAPISKGRGLPPQGMDDERDPLAGKMQEQQAKSRNVERQKKLELDTEKLLSLATELKEQVGKTDKNILSVDVIKKADEIEKLAKSVKDRMKG